MSSLHKLTFTAQLQQNFSKLFCIPDMILSLLVEFYNSAYFLLYSPFRFKLNENGRYVLVKNIFQTVIWLFVNLLGDILLRSRSVVSSFEKLQKSPKNPANYFDLMANIFDGISGINLQLVFWMEQEKLCSLVNFLATSYKPKHQKYKICKRWCNRLFYLMFNALILYETIWLHVSPYIYNCCGWPENLLNQYNDIYYISKKNASYSKPNIVLVIVLYATKFPRLISAYYIDLMMLVWATCIWWINNAYSKKLATEIKLKAGINSIFRISEKSKKDSFASACQKSFTCNHAQNQFAFIKEVYDRFNSIFGNFLVSYIGVSIVFYSQSLDRILANLDIKMIISFSCAFFAFVFFADSIEKVVIYGNTLNEFLNSCT